MTRGEQVAGKRRRGRPRKGEELDTRRLLLDAALELFARQGFASTTVREIAALAHVHDSAIYFHFANKDAMYAALFEEMGPPSLESLCPDLEEMAAADPRVAIGDVVHRLFDVWSTPSGRRFASVVLRDGAGAGGARGLVSAVEAAKQRLAEPFARWQAAGLFRADLSAEQLVWELMAPLDVIWFFHLRPDATDEDLATAERMVDAHLEFFFTCTTRSRR